MFHQPTVELLYEISMLCFFLVCALSMWHSRRRNIPAPVRVNKNARPWLVLTILLGSAPYAYYQMSGSAKSPGDGLFLLQWCVIIMAPLMALDVIRFVLTDKRFL